MEQLWFTPTGKASYETTYSMTMALGRVQSLFFKTMPSECLDLSTDLEVAGILLFYSNLYLKKPHK